MLIGIAGSVTYGDGRCPFTFGERRNPWRNPNAAAHHVSSTTTEVGIAANAAAETSPNDHGGDRLSGGVELATTVSNPPCQHHHAYQSHG